jgi:hypothetical protein
VACGDPLAGTDYRGEALFKLEGQVLTVNTLPEPLRDAEFAVSMFWSPNEPLETRTLVEQPSVTTTVRFPSTFTLRVFEAPAEQHFPSADATTAFGLVLVYVDMNHDRRYDFSSGDRLLGGSLNRGLLYAKSDVAAESSPSGEALSAGFNVVMLPLESTTCMGMPPPMGAPNFDGPRFGCGEGRPPCPPGTTCDFMDGVCAASDVFELVIVPGFGLDHAFCRR